MQIWSHLEAGLCSKFSFQLKISYILAGAASESLYYGNRKYSLLIGWKRINLLQTVSIVEQLNSNRIGRLSARESALVNENEHIPIRLPGLPFQTNEKKRVEKQTFHPASVSLIDLVFTAVFLLQKIDRLFSRQLRINCTCEQIRLSNFYPWN